jgi:hypothetical protein
MLYARAPMDVNPRVHARIAILHGPVERGGVLNPKNSAKPIRARFG